MRLLLRQEVAGRIGGEDEGGGGKRGSKVPLLVSLLVSLLVLFFEEEDEKEAHAFSLSLLTRGKDVKWCCFIFSLSLLARGERRQMVLFCCLDAVVWMLTILSDELCQLQKLIKMCHSNFRPIKSVLALK